MIPVAQITQWRRIAPWADDMQVEQDLILSRIIVDIFSDSFLRKELAFRGGTALNKLFFTPAARYSEDIDLVRTGSGPIKPIIDALHDKLDGWLGMPKTERNEMSFKLRYYFQPETFPAIKMRVKIEINVRESFAFFGYDHKIFSVNSTWFKGEAPVTTYQFEELLATKLRALYQRKKGRDLFDLWLALRQKDFNIAKLLEAFQHYFSEENTRVTHQLFEKNLDKKLQEPAFIDDIRKLLAPFSAVHWNIFEAAEEIKNKILINLPD